MKRIATVVGARPQFIKAAVVSHALQRQGLKEEIIHTGQHFDANMSQDFFTQLEIPVPAHHLNIANLPHGAMTGRMLEALEDIWLSAPPDAVVVYGDTNSTLAAGLAAAKLQIPIAHIEAGARSFNRAMPEEINRVLVDHLATWCFTASESATQLLAQEGITQQVYCVGDVMQDATRRFQGKVELSRLRHDHGIPEHYGLLTLHRAENTRSQARFEAWLEALEQLSQELPLVFPVHPRTRQCLQRWRPTWRPENLIFLEPQDYLNSLTLQAGAACVLTDSGGMQKEAYYLRRPCLTLRSETEWTETLDTGWNRLVPRPEALLSAWRQMQSEEQHQRPWPTLYGDGKSADKIVEILRNSR